MRKWTKEEADIVYEGKKKGWTYEQISEELNEEYFFRTAKAVRGFIIRNGSEAPKKKRYEACKPKVGNDVEEKYKEEIDKIYKFRETLLKVTTEKFIKVGKPINADKKVLTISDFHIPFVNRHVIENALYNHSDAGTLVINGDFFDAHIVGMWPKNKTILLKWEYQLAVEWMKLFVEIFPKVVLVSGNHEKRTDKSFSRNLDPAVSFLTSPDLLERLAKGYDFDDEGDFVKVHKWGKIVKYESGMLNWYTKIGKTIFVHPSKGYSTVPLKTTIKAADYFLHREDYQCLVMAHTHKQSSYYYKNRMLIEQGCACVPLEYEANGAMSFDGQIFGYAVIYMDKQGNVDFQKSGPIYVGTGTPVKILESDCLHE